MGHSEELGTGIKNVYQYIEQYSGSRNVDFSEKDVFIVKVPLKEVINQETENKAAQKAAQKTAQKTAQKAAQKVISGTRKEILNLLKRNPEYTKDDLKEILGKADGTIKEHLSILKKEGYIKRVGGRKSGHWKIIENENL